MANFKGLVKRGLRSFGISASGVEYAQEYIPELHLARLFKQLDVRCVLDVGANTGQYRTFLREHVGFDGTILSFEPVPAHAETLRRLARTTGDDRWLIEQVAVGETPGTAEINVTAGDMLSSFLRPAEDSPDMVVTARVAVNVVTLDSMATRVSALAPLPTVFLKVDTQGFDLHVLRGAAQVLPQIAGVQVELSLVPIYEGMPPFQEVHDYLTHAGFGATGFFVTSREATLRVREVDGVYVNARH